MKPLKTGLTSGIAFLLPFTFLLSLPVVIIAQTTQVTEIVTDFSGYWRSGSGVGEYNPVFTNKSHNVVSFKYNGVTYSTGVGDTILSNRSIVFTLGNFKALPISSIGGTVVSNSTFILMGALDDGVASGTATPLPSVRIKDVLTDGINGLNIGTGVTNLPVTSALTFPVNNIDVNAISDAKPDIVCTQIAATGGSADVLYFVNSSGVRVGNTVSVSWATVLKVGEHTCDLFTLNAVSCDAAIINGVNVVANGKEIRIAAFKLSEFGITTGNAADVVNMIIIPGGASDPAFVAYNADAFIVATPVIVTQPVTQVICPNVSQSVTFTVVATGTGLSYQWNKNNIAIAGATSSSYSISNVTGTDAGSYDVTVTNVAGSVYSSIAYLNTVILSQPTPLTRTIVTGNSVTMAITASNATGYQWKRAGADISGATAASYTISSLTTTNGGVFTVNVINAASSGCASVVSSAVTVTPVTTIYSKSSGLLSAAATWGANTDGSGSSPLNFTLAEHTFIVKNNSNTGADLTIAGTFDLANAAIVITPGTTLNAGKIISSGTGTLSGSATSNLIANGVSDLYFKSGSQVIKNLTIGASGNVTLRTALNITAGNTPGVVVVSTGATLNTSDLLTLKSDINGTASVGTSTGTIVGKATIERYILARRAWRLLCVPVTSVGASTINSVWQEGASSSSSDLSPGYGLHITGGSVADGFDQSPTNAASIRTINSDAVWLPIPNTNVKKITDYAVYMLFVRGNRSYDIATTLSTTTPTETVLRVTGNLYQGLQPGVAINAAGLTVIANPYASPVNFSTIIAGSSNVKNRLRVWDPSLAGAKGVGAFVTLDWDGTAYTAVPASSMTSIIQAGQAFFTESSDGLTTGNLIIAEANKSLTGSIVPFRITSGADAKLNINLKIFNADNTKSVADGVLALFNDDYSSVINKDDALKIYNPNDNISISKNNAALTIERTVVPANSDTLKINLSETKTAQYQLEVVPQNFSTTNLVPTLYDNYLKTFTPLSITDTTAYSFNINTTIDSSKSADRFSIVFRTSAVLSVKYISVKAYKLNAASIAIEWRPENQQGNENYYVEKSNTGNTYDVIGSVAANIRTATYQITDQQPLAGDNIYRIKTRNIDGSLMYSNSVKVNIKNGQAQVNVFPNPVAGKSFSIQFQQFEKSVFNANLVNVSGQVVYKNVINYAGNNSSETIQLPAGIAPGTYTLTLSKNGLAVYTTPLIIN